MVSAQFYTWLSCTDICHARCSDVRRVTGMQVVALMKRWVNWYSVIIEIALEDRKGAGRGRYKAATLIRLTLRPCIVRATFSKISFPQKCEKAGWD